MEPFQDARYPFDRAGLYEIHVVGDVDVSMFEYLAGMTSVHCGPSDDSNMIVTVLTGRLSDQAALNGVLNTLYDRRYTLTQVRRAEDRLVAESA